MAEIITADDLMATKVGKLQDSVKILNKAITAEKRENHPNTSKIAKWQKAVVAYQATEKKVKSVHAKCKELGLVDGDVTLESLLSLQTKLKKAGTSIEEVMQGAVNLEDIQDLELGSSWLGNDGALTNLAKGTGKDIVNGNGKAVGLSKALTVLGVASFATSGLNALLAASGSAATVGSIAGAMIPNILTFAGTTLSTMFTFSPLGTTALLAMAAIKVVPTIARFTNKAISKYNQISRTRSLQEQLKANADYSDAPSNSENANAEDLGLENEMGGNNGVGGVGLGVSEQESQNPAAPRPGQPIKTKRFMNYPEAVAQYQAEQKNVVELAKNYVSAMQETEKVAIALREAEAESVRQAGIFDELSKTDITPDNQAPLDRAQNKVEVLRAQLKKCQTAENVAAGKYEKAMAKLRMATQILTNSYGKKIEPSVNKETQETYMASFAKSRAKENMIHCDAKFMRYTELQSKAENAFDDQKQGLLADAKQLRAELIAAYVEYGFTEAEIDEILKSPMMSSSNVNANANDREENGFEDSLNDLNAGADEYESSKPIHFGDNGGGDDKKGKKETGADEHSLDDSLRDIDAAADQVDGKTTKKENPAQEAPKTTPAGLKAEQIATADACKATIAELKKKIKTLSAAKTEQAKADLAIVKAQLKEAEDALAKHTQESQKSEDNKKTERSEKEVSFLRKFYQGVEHSHGKLTKQNIGDLEAHIGKIQKAASSEKGAFRDFGVQIETAEEFELVTGYLKGVVEKGKKAEKGKPINTKTASHESLANQGFNEAQIEQIIGKE